MEAIKKDDYYKFLDLFKYNYCVEYSTISFIHMVIESSDYLKKEILSNFISLNRDEKLAYLDWLKFDIENLKKNVWSTKDRLDNWRTKYNVPEDFIFNSEYISTPLYQFLQSDRPSFQETLEDDYNPDQEASIDDFYNYFYGQGVDDMLSFIEKHENKLNSLSNPMQSFDKDENNTNSNKSTLVESSINRLLQYYEEIELPQKSTVMFYYDNWSGLFLLVKSEIQDNLIKLPKEDRTLYLESLANKIRLGILDFGYYEQDIKKWYSKYDISEDLLFSKANKENELYRILTSWPPNPDQVLLPNYNTDTEDIQNDFYNYIMLKNANSVLNFIRLQIMIIENPEPKEERIIEEKEIQESKSSPIFTPSFIDFLETTNIIDKYKSWSCSRYYYVLSEHFINVEADILNLYTHVDQNDKQKFIDAHLKKIHSITKHHIGGSSGWAEVFLKDNGYTLEYVFDTLIFEPDTSLDTIPGCLRLSYEEFVTQVDSADAYNLRLAFFHFLSDYFELKLQNFFKNLFAQNVPSLQTEKTIETPATDITSMIVDFNTTLHYLKMLSKGLDVPIDEIKSFENIFEGGSIDLFDPDTVRLYEYQLFPEFSLYRENYDLPPIHEFIFKLVAIQNEFIKIENYNYHNYCQIGAIYKQFTQLFEVFNVLKDDEFVENYLEKCLKKSFLESNNYQRFLNIIYRFELIIRSLALEFWNNHSDEFKNVSLNSDTVLKSTSPQISPPQPLDTNPQPSQTTLPNPTPDKNTIPNAYTYTKYISNLSALSDTLVSLKKNNFVAQDTDIKDFRKIFNDTTPSKPITWIGTISELAYFIKYLHNELKLIQEIKTNIWKVTSKIFVDDNGKLSTVNASVPKRLLQKQICSKKPQNTSCNTLHHPNFL